MSGWIRSVIVTIVFCCGAAAVLGAAVLQRVKPVAITVGQRTLILRDMADPAGRAQLRLHEAMHRSQFRQHGLLRFLVRYALDADQRLRWEAEASAVALCPVRGRATFAFAVAQQVEALRQYGVVGAVPESVARAHLAVAFRNGSVCGHLLRHAADHPVDTVYLLRPRAADLTTAVSGL
jgi:hypothetical protein